MTDPRREDMAATRRAVRQYLQRNRQLRTRILEQIDEILAVMDSAMVKEWLVKHSLVVLKDAKW